MRLCKELVWRNGLTGLLILRFIPSKNFSPDMVVISRIGYLRLIAMV
jgi:hypothetical protein